VIGCVAAIAVQEAALIGMILACGKLDTSLKAEGRTELRPGSAYKWTGIAVACNAGSLLLIWRWISPVSTALFVAGAVSTVVACIGTLGYLQGVSRREAEPGEGRLPPAGAISLSASMTPRFTASGSGP
jgi:hypothetical protein